MADAGAGGYHELRRYRVAQSPTWAHPTPIGDGFLIKDQTSLALWK